MTGRVLVTDGNERAALAAVRSLGKAGFHVETQAWDSPSLSGASRYCAREHLVPSPLNDPLAYADRTLQLCSSREFDVVLPISDASLLAILPRRAELRGARLPFPSYEAYQRISDKAHLMTTAEELGLFVPRQTVIEAGMQREGPVSCGPDFPVVIKPSRSVVTDAGRRKQMGVTYASTPDELEQGLSRYPQAAYPLLVQERISGSGIGVFLLIWEGRVLASFAHRRLREKPPTGGVSVYRESIPLDAELLELSSGLLGAYDWAGVAMVEFKRSSRADRLYLMEVNGRFWGSLQLAVDAGVDFPRLLVEAALGQSPSPVSPYQVGTRSRWFLGDLDHLLLRLLRNYDTSALPPGSGGRLRALWDFVFTCFPGSRNEVLRIGDPRPGFRELREWARRLVR